MTARTLLQMFQWYTPEGRLWNEVARRATELADLGITDLWLPPSGKGAGGASSVGYDVYDLFDLGEFDQKGTIATKYGTRQEFETASQAARSAGLGLIHDGVFNHRMGADEVEDVRVRRVNPENRTEIDPDIVEARAHTRFTFPGRNGAHSEFVWDQACFSGIDRLDEPEEEGIFRIVNSYGNGDWDSEVDTENGNFDYLMGADVEFRNPAVYEELKFWGRWLSEQVSVAGFRLDAVKHIPAWFIRDWVGHCRETIDPDLLVIAEYWHSDLSALQTYLERVDHQLALFDVALHHRFADASRAGGGFDLRTLLDGTLVAAHPDHAVTFVENHDTQPLQSLESPVEDWFKPLAYALILLREGGLPCLFLPDLDGAAYTGEGGDGKTYKIAIAPVACLPRLLEARRRFAHGAQTDLFEAPDLIGFIRHGTESDPGCVVVLANGKGGAHSVTLGADHAHAAYGDLLGHHPAEIVTDEAGQAEFCVSAGSVSVWVRKDTL